MRTFAELPWHQRLEPAETQQPRIAGRGEPHGDRAGRIEREGDVDSFRFKGTKGQIYTFEVFARRNEAASALIADLTVAA